MTTPPSTHRNAPPRLDQLLHRYIADAARPDVTTDEGPEVELHEVHGGFQTDSTVLWDEACRVFGLLGSPCERLPQPPEWTRFTRIGGGTPAIPLAAGFFPQRLQDVQFVLSGPSVEATELADASEAFPKLFAWAESAVRSDPMPAALIASGILAGLGQPAAAVDALANRRPASSVGREYELWANQMAAVLWMAGRSDEAVARWQALPASSVTRFNLGMTDYATDRKPEAAAHLTAAGDVLPESSGWTHLARLMAALA